MKYILVGVGGAVGSLFRYKLGKVISEKYDSTFPLGTLIINLTGAFLLGLVNGYGVGRNIYLLLGDGFLGAYTTFSTFMYEGFTLFQENEKLNAFIYIFGTLFLGVIGYFSGFGLIRLII